MRYTGLILETFIAMVFVRKNIILSKFLEHLLIKTLYQYQISHFKFQNEGETSREIQVVQIRKKFKNIN